MLATDTFPGPNFVGKYINVMAGFSITLSMSARNGFGTARDATFPLRWGFCLTVSEILFADPRFVFTGEVFRFVSTGTESKENTKLETPHHILTISNTKYRLIIHKYGKQNKTKTKINICL